MDGFLGKLKELHLWKKTPFLITAAVVLLLLLFCSIKIAMPSGEWVYESESGHFFMEDTPTGEMVVCDGISLTPGVYRIELEYETDTDLVALCNVADGTVFHKGLLSNGEHMYAGLHRTGFDIWLYESTQDLKVMVSYGGKGNLTTGNLRVVETNGLWTMLFVIILFGGILVCAVQIFCYYDRCFQVAPDKKRIFFWLAVISFVASLPYLCGDTLTGPDLTYHLQRIEGVKDGLLGGQFPVRLEPRWMYDHGYANGIFYCNTFLYLPALLRLLGFPISTSYNIYCIALNIATAWISYYCFGRMLGEKKAGVICSALYTLSVFRIYKLIVATAVGEGTAVTFLPLVLYGLYRIFTEEPEEERYKTAWVPLMLGLGGLIQSHVLTCEITGAAMILFCIIFIRKIFHVKVFLALLKGAVSTVGVCLWFLVPFLDYYLTQDVHIRHVSARTIQDRGLYPTHLPFHFWRVGGNIPNGENGMQYSHPVGVGLVLCAALTVFLILWFSGKFRKTEKRELNFVKAVAVIGVLMLYMSLNLFPWDRIQALNSVTAALVSSLQFPNRFLGWGTACLVLVFGFCVKYFHENRCQVFHWITVGAAILGVTTSSMYLLDFVNYGQEYFELYNEEGMGFGYISGAEYLIEGTEGDKLTFADPVAGKSVEIQGFEKSYLRAELYCTNGQAGESYVDLPMLLYKGYLAVREDTGQKLTLASGENHVIRILIPGGFEGKIKVDFVSPAYWRISEWVTVLAVVVIALWGGKGQRRRVHPE